jgi:SAM-dependent methyltransferase
MEYTGTDNLEVMKLAKNYNANLVQLVLNFCDGSKNILDFGAGLGTYAEPIRDHKFDVKCFEIDEKLVTGLKNNSFEVYSTSQQVPNSSFDAIYSVNVLEHTEEDEKILVGFFNWLKPKGKLLIYVPAFMHLYSSMDKKVGHHRRYSRKELIQKVKNAGFNIQESSYADSLGYLATVLYKIVGSGKGDINSKSLVAYDRVAFPISLGLDNVFKHFFGKNLFLIATKK